MTTLQKNLAQAIESIRPLFEQARAAMEKRLKKNVSDGEALELLFGVHTSQSVNNDMTPAQVAEASQMSKDYILREIRKHTRTGGREGLGPVKRLGHRTIRIPREAFERWNQKHLS